MGHDTLEDGYLQQTGATVHYTLQQCSARSCISLSAPMHRAGVWGQMTALRFPQRGIYILRGLHVARISTSAHGVPWWRVFDHSTRHQHSIVLVQTLAKLVRVLRVGNTTLCMGYPVVVLNKCLFAVSFNRGSLFLHIHLTVAPIFPAPGHFIVQIFLTQASFTRPS
jgi:hypothetical protein